MRQILHLTIGGTNVSNGHSPQIRENGELLVRMCRGESHFSQKRPLANVGESGESAQHGSAQARVGCIIDTLIEQKINFLIF